MSLKQSLENEEKKPLIVEDCLQLIDAEVKEKSGFGGMAIKAGYKAVKGVKPGFVKKVVHDLLPDFADALEPLSEEAVAAGKSVGAHLKANSGRAADALLGVTDSKAERSTNGLVKSTYKKLRGSAKKNVEAAVPRLADLVDAHS
ncbi:MAG: hypothetical protein AB8H86_04705 [Polyangiales bacterium]